MSLQKEFRQVRRKVTKSKVVGVRSFGGGVTSETWPDTELILQERRRKRKDNSWVYYWEDLPIVDEEEEEK